MLTALLINISKIAANYITDSSERRKRTRNIMIPIDSKMLNVHEWKILDKNLTGYADDDFDEVLRFPV